jgi:hypothetical protein
LPLVRDFFGDEGGGAPRPAPAAITKAFVVGLLLAIVFGGVAQLLR